MHLYIDTSENRKTTIKLDGANFVKKYPSPRQQDALVLINQCLNKVEKKIEDITKITVNPGPGKFTSLRVGIAIANALGYALKVPVNGQLPANKPVIPRYGNPPNITQPKK